MKPENLDKYLYIRKTPTWLIRIFYALGILTWLPVLIDTLAEGHKDWFFALFVIPIVLILSLHYFASFSLALFYKQFDLKKHFRLVKRYWEKNTEPSVDVFLPICGEGLDILDNTWKYVSKLKYTNKKVYVLDDSKDEIEEHKQLAAFYGFNYIERPNKGEMKKAGNLKYAYLRTDGDIIAIFDADFAPHEDYLIELVPYMSEKKVGIVQSPQYFPVNTELHKEAPLSYGGARAQEVFYRIIQVARDRFGGTHCCGTCALYRRAALDSIGGFVQMGHSEDAHTGLGLNKGGWVIRYVPLLVSIGASPDSAYAFFHQQHRWCLGNLIMLLDKNFWKAKIPWQTKYSYTTGFLFYLHQPFVVLISLQLFWVLYFYNGNITLTGGYLFYPHIIWATFYMFFMYLAPFRWGYLYAIMMRLYSYCHAIGSVILGKSVGWIPTNAKHAGVSAAFRQTVTGIAIHVLVNITLIAILIRNHKMHFSNYNYITVQFWVFYNTALAIMILWQVYKTLETAERKQIVNGTITHTTLIRWKTKLIGKYVAVISAACLVVAYIPTIHSPFTSSISTPSVTTTSAQTNVTVPATNTAYLFTQDYSLLDDSQGIFELQKFLNTHGAPLATDGPGSAGNETTFFGQRTYRALIIFQKQYELSEKGHFGKVTRDLINALNTGR